jgi:hypothetical protein
MAAFYRATLADFLAHSPDEILGALLRSAVGLYVPPIALRGDRSTLSRNG